MKKTALLAAPLALAAGLMLAAPAHAAPEKTPARACTLYLINLAKTPQSPAYLDFINQLAKSKGLPGLPEVAGAICDKDIPNGTDKGTDNRTNVYPGSGPVILRTSEYARYQQYCTGSVSVPGLFTGDPIPGLPVPEGLFVVGTDCTEEVNPLIL